VSRQLVNREGEQRLVLAVVTFHGEYEIENDIGTFYVSARAQGIAWRGANRGGETTAKRG
jgi:hypothetical protein